jgi:hypothetical protein
MEGELATPLVLVSTLGLLSALSYSTEFDAGERRTLRRYMARRGLDPAEILRQFGVRIWLRRFGKLSHDGIPMDLGLLSGEPDGEGGCPGLGFGTPEGFKEQVHFFPKDVARLAWVLQLDRLGTYDLEERDPEADFDVIKQAVCIPSLRCNKGPMFSPAWGLTLTLYHLAGVFTKACATAFNIHEPDANAIINTVLESIDRWRYLLKVGEHPNIQGIFLDRLDEFCMAINEHCALEDPHAIGGFCDGTECEHPCPSRCILNQALRGHLYDSGRPQDPTRSYTKSFCFRILLLNIPSGIILHATDLFAGRFGDNAVQGRSDIQDFHVVRNIATGAAQLRWGDPVEAMAKDIEEIKDTHTTTRFYADKGLIRSGRILPAVKFCTPDSDEGIFNTVMKRVRVSAEHNIGRVFNLWKVLRMCWSMRVFQGRQQTYITDALLLTNLHDIFYPNQISQFFKCRPPSLREYIVKK